MNLLAIVIAAIASMIAYGQYKTAREKLILDLFDKRIKTFSIVHKVIEELGSANRIGFVYDDDVKALEKAVYPATYLFGPEVSSCLLDIRTSMIKVMQAGGTVNSEASAYVREDQGDDETLRSAQVRLFESADAFMNSVRPYITMDQKLPRTLSGLLAEFSRNRGPRSARSRMI